MSVRQQVRALSAGDRAILEAQLVDGERPMADWFATFAALAGVDAAVGAGRARTTRHLCFGWLGLLVGAFVLLLLLPIAALVLLLVGLPVLALLHGRARELRAIDLANGPMETLPPLLSLLAADTPPGRPVTVRADLREPTIDAKRTGEQDRPVTRPVLSLKWTFFANPWLELRTRFADGAAVRVEVTEHVRRATRIKTNPRGKRKLKVKHKRRVQLDVQVAFPRRRYALAPVAPGTVSAADRERVVEGEDRIVVRERAVFKETGSGGAIQPHRIVDLLAAAYRRVEPAKGGRL